MKLSDIRTDARYMISPQLTSSDYPDVDLDRNANNWYKMVMGWIIGEDGEWEAEEDIMYHEFTAGVAVYELPKNVLRILKGEVMYAVGGSFVPLNFRSVTQYQEIAEGNATRTIDDPTKPTADYIGSSLEIKPVSTVTVQNGIKLWAQFDLVTLDSDNNMPSFPEPVHRVISLGAAFDFALAEEMYKKKDEIAKLIFGDQTKRDDKGLKGVIENMYANRAGAKRDRLTPSKKTSFR